LLPYSTCGIEGLLRKACQPIAVRPQGLVTLSTLCSLRRLAGFVSHRQRSWDSPFEAFSSRKASGGFPPEGPTYRFGRRSRMPEGIPMRADNPRFLGFAPFESPWRSNPCLAGQSLDAPLGFTLPRHAGKCLVQDFARTPLTCLAYVNSAYAACTTESRSALAWFHRVVNGKPQRTAEQPS
jgi:hypothetical protein